MPLTRLLRHRVWTLRAMVVALLLTVPTLALAQTPNAPIVQILPRGGTIVGASSVQATFYLCGDAYGYDESTLTIRLDGVDVSGYFTAGITDAPAWFTTNCVWRQQYTGTIPLTAQLSTFQVRVNANGPSYSLGGDQVQFSLPTPGAGVTVTTTGMYANASPGAVASRTFKVTNTSSVSDSYTLQLSCTGQAGTCTMNQPGVVTLSTGLTLDVVASVPMPGTSGSSALVKLKALSQTNSAAVDSSWSEVTASATPAQGVVLASSPGYQDRSLCTRVTVPGGAIQCGDLVLDHALHSMQTMSRAWTPRLIYNSQTAAPSPTIAANVTICCTPADLVTAVVLVNGAQVASGEWSGNNWGANNTRRIALNWNAATVPTGAYDYTLEVSRWNGGVRTVIATVPGRQAIVNRSTSPFGAGWWLSGFETIVAVGATNDVLWIGGDGSTRIYHYLGGWRWSAPNVSAPDTLTYNGTTYSRLLPGGGHVDFNAGLQQIATVNRNGWGSTYQYNGSGQLWRILLPGDPSSNVRYEFSYSSTGNQLLLVGFAGQTRATTAALSSGVLTSITDGDGFYEQFEGSPSQPQRMVARTDKRGTRTTYSYAPGFTVSGVSTPTGTGQTVTIGYLDPRLHGLVVGGGTGTSEQLDSLVTRIDGPRSDVNDVTTLWENALGAPERTRDALGNGSSITYSAAWPGLAAEVRDASHLVTSSAIDPVTGLVSSTTTTNPFADGRNQTTSYTWNTQWRVPTQIQSPAGDYTQMGYDGAGNRIWQQPGSDASRRVTFGYDGSGRVTSVTAPGGPASTLGYGALGNLSSTTSPLGWTSTIIRDAFGRDSLATSPIDATHSSTARTLYDGLGRVSQTTTVGPAMNGAPADSIRLDYEYDATSNRRITRRRFTQAGSWQQLQHISVFDTLGRMSREIDDDGQETRFAYDLAGNVLVRTSPRLTTVTSTYDALNRVVSQVHSPVSHAGPMSCTLPQGFLCSYTFPTRGSSVTIVPDTAIFRYDGAGRLSGANNRYARITRAYTPNGALVTDELRIRNVLTAAPSPGENVGESSTVPAPLFPENWYTGGGGGGEQQRAGKKGGSTPDPILTQRFAGGGGSAVGLNVGLDEDFTSHVYLTRYHYDLNGRRDTLYLPLGGKKQSYSYHALTGDLEGTVDALGYGHSMSRDLRGRVTGTNSPGWSVTQGYDDDNNMTSYNGGGITVDATGRVLYATGFGGAAVNKYDGLGRLIEALNESADATTERFGYDALGNRTFSSRSVANPWAGDDGVRHTTTSLTGKVSAIVSNPATWQYFVYEQTFEYDASGNGTHESSRERTDNYSRYWENRSFYGADDKLRVFNQHTGISQPSDYYGPGTRHGLYEEYWYDALGRRVLMRSRVDAGCSTWSDTTCASYVKRTVWEGDQVLHELRAAGSDTTSGSQMEQDGLFVTYTHLAGIDAPVAVMLGWSSMVVPHANWRAVFDSGHAVVGSLPRIRWPGSTETLDQAPNTGPHQQWAWYGDLLGGQRDGSGQKYMRNRYYDPAKGTFTQKDPIGLAGGLNLYGFAGGDPVNFSDPFGLCPKDAGGNGTTEELSDCPEGSSGWYGHRVAAGRGSRFWNEVGGTLASCAEAGNCFGAIAGAWGAGGGKSIGLTTRPIRSVNQMNRQVLRGQSPKSIARMDKGKVKGEQDNVHFDDGSALNRDGTWKHGGRQLTRSEREWLESGGFKTPK